MSILHKPSFAANPDVQPVGIQSAGDVPAETLTERDQAAGYPDAEIRQPLPLRERLDADLLAKIDAIKARETAE